MEKHLCCVPDRRVGVVGLSPGKGVVCGGAATTWPHCHHSTADHMRLLKVIPPILASRHCQTADVVVDEGDIASVDQPC